MEVKWLMYNEVKLKHNVQIEWQSRLAFVCKIFRHAEYESKINPVHLMYTERWSVLQ